MKCPFPSFLPTPTSNVSAALFVYPAGTTIVDHSNKYEEIVQSQTCLIYCVVQRPVGGGAAGCVIAARLSEDPDVTVALLEVGGEETANPQLHVPLLAPVIDKQSTPEMIDYHLEPHGNSCKSMENKVHVCISNPRERTLANCKPLEVKVQRSI